MPKYTFTVSGSQLIVSLVPVESDVQPTSMSYLAPSFKIGVGKINAYEYGQPKQSFLFTEIGEIDGVEPTDLQDAFDKLTTATANFNWGGAAPIPLSGTTEGNPVTGNIELQGKRSIGVYGGDGFAFLSFNDNGNETQLTRYDSDGSYQNSITLTTSANNNNTVISSNNPSSEGLVGGSDYTPNITELAYTQKIYVDTQSQVSSATSGTVNLDSGKRDLVFIHEAGATTSLTLNLPTSPKNNQKVTIMSVGGIVGLTLATAVGTIVGAVTTLAALGSVELIWNTSQNKWYKIK